MTKQMLRANEVAGLSVSPFPHSRGVDVAAVDIRELSVSGYFLVEPKVAGCEDFRHHDAANPVIRDRMAGRRRRALGRLFFGI